MQVAIIGSGNVATVLGRTWLRKGYRIRQVYSHTPAHAAVLADELNAEAVSDLHLLDSKADIYLVAVTDDALPAVAAALSLSGKLVVHTAGSVSKEVLNKASDQYGVLWPVKMIRSSMQELGTVSIVIDGSSEPVTERIRQIALQLSGNITVADDAMRVKMHLAAAVVSNFTNHLYHLAADYCQAEKIDFSLLYPIIQETARQIQHAHPATVQAGPAFRADMQTIHTHLRLLDGYPALQALYEQLSNSILQKTSATPRRCGW